MRHFAFSVIIFLFSSIFFSCVTLTIEKKDEPIFIKPKPTIFDLIKEFRNSYDKKIIDLNLKYYGKVDSICADTSTKSIGIFFSREFSHNPIREEIVSNLYSEIKNYFGEEYKDYSFKLYSLNKPIEELIPNFYRKNFDIDTSRLAKLNPKRPKQIVTRLNDSFEITNGLQNRNIVLWHSHGWYYNNKEDRWEWQRPRLFQAVEDKIPMSFTIPYLIPMLENAGANVFVPRERDFQINEVVIDNDSPNDIKSKSYIEHSTNTKIKWQTNNNSKGFAYGTPPYPINYNPFNKGTSKFILSESKSTSFIEWIPNIPETGNYAVYISFTASEKNVDDAKYSVYHLGGKTEFLINQQIGGSTWIYLGTFKFNQGKNNQTGKVILENSSNAKGKIITADAVRFGGGMGLIERNGTTSGRPKFLEGAKYWLQYAGMPDTLIYNLNKNKDDYRDDYQCRAEYGNYLIGAPFGPNKNRNEKGLGIPIDLSLAFHTDAGISKSDTTIGTLAIYSISDFDSNYFFPDSVSRFANRDLADLVQSQIVDDIRALHDLNWNRRQLRNADYSECVRPNIPSLLLELLSHQNFLDMKFVHNPNFRFDVSRAIYKGFLKFLSAHNKTNFVVQPLPVTHFSSELDKNRNVILKWKPMIDKLEETAIPKSFKVYTRIENNDFNNGQITKDTFFIIKKIDEKKIYSFKVTAINAGGESFPSEILSVCWFNNNKNPLLIINGFTRISAPSSIDELSYSGFTNNLDKGVADKYSFLFTGDQYDFAQTSQFKTNDSPGHGASHSDYETKIILGNTFDFPFIHGQAIKECGYSFVSASKLSVSDGMIDLSKYKLIDLILGEEKETHWQKAKMDSVNGTRFKIFPFQLRNHIEKYLNQGGNILVSGSYIGTDLFNKLNIDSNEILFAKNILKYKWVSSYASKDGKVFATKNSFFKNLGQFDFNTNINEDIYEVEAPDAIEPQNGSNSILRYSENQFSAGIGFKEKYGVIVIGFPFETIIDNKIRIDIMKSILKFFEL